MGCDAAGARRLAYFVSPHGFGHAARACAVMQAVRTAWPDVVFEVFTLVPEWFFAESLGSGFRHHLLRTDVGTGAADDASRRTPRPRPAS